MTATLLMLVMGLVCALWCIMLVTGVVYLDSSQRMTVLYRMNESLSTILERSGELRREASRDKRSPSQG